MSVKSWRLPVAWLHPPKTGSSFGLTVYRHACAHIPEDADVGCLPPIFGLTQPFPIRQHCVGGFTSSYRVDMHHPSNLIEDYGRLLAMLRAPELQKASLLSFVEKLATDSNYTHQCSVVCEAPMTTSGLPEAVARQACEAARSRKKLELMQLVLPFMRGCQAKMLHGYPCFHPMATPELEAMQRLTAARVPGAFAFVGLTERWVESICLFHFLLEQGRPPVPREFKNTRPTMTSDARQRRILSRADEWSVIAGDNSDVRGWLLQDRWDGLLFDLATRSFNRRLTAALNQSQWVETCMRRHSLGDQVIREDPAEAGVAPKNRQMFLPVGARGCHSLGS